ncbi:unnamed protein product [Effrenium voratum]|nr:unnamed protein product [Effrenium voratum]
MVCSDATGVLTVSDAATELGVSGTSRKPGLATQWWAPLLLQAAPLVLPLTASFHCGARGPPAAPAATVACTHGRGACRWKPLTGARPASDRWRKSANATGTSAPCRLHVIASWATGASGEHAASAADSDSGAETSWSMQRTEG